jgi:hypothetical protein
MVTLSSGSALGFTLVGSELRLRTQGQSTPTSQLFVTSFPASAVVSESTVEFPNVESLFDPSAGIPPGFAGSLVDVSIDAGADYLAIDFDNAGSNGFATGFQNTYVFTFTVPTALQITDILIDPSTTLGLTPNRVTFEGNELFVNVQGLSFNSNSFARVNLSGTITSDSGAAAAVPEPNSVLGLGILALGGAVFKRRTKREAVQ